MRLIRAPNTLHHVLNTLRSTQLFADLIAADTALCITDGGLRRRCLRSWLLLFHLLLGLGDSARCDCFCNLGCSSSTNACRLEALEARLRDICLGFHASTCQLLRCCFPYTWNSSQRINHFLAWLRHEWVGFSAVYEHHAALHRMNDDREM